MSYTARGYTLRPGRKDHGTSVQFPEERKCRAPTQNHVTAARANTGQRRPGEFPTDDVKGGQPASAEATRGHRPGYTDGQRRRPRIGGAGRTDRQHQRVRRALTVTGSGQGVGHHPHAPATWARRRARGPSNYKRPRTDGNRRSRLLDPRVIHSCEILSPRGLGPALGSAPWPPAPTLSSGVW